MAKKPQTTWVRYYKVRFDGTCIDEYDCAFSDWQVTVRQPSVTARGDWTRYNKRQFLDGTFAETREEAVRRFLVLHQRKRLNLLRQADEELALITKVETKFAGVGDACGPDVIETTAKVSNDKGDW